MIYGRHRPMRQWRLRTTGREGGKRVLQTALRLDSLATKARTSTMVNGKRVHRSTLTTARKKREREREAREGKNRKSHKNPSGRMCATNTPFFHAQITLKSLLSCSTTLKRSKHSMNSNLLKYVKICKCDARGK